MAIDAQQLINQTNEYRKAQGLPLLTVNPALTAAAQYRADDMAKTGAFSHTVATTAPSMKEGWGFMKSRGYDYLHAGENLAQGGGDFDVSKAWQKSPTHNANLISDKYSDIGLATATGTYKGKPVTFVVQFFGSQKQPALKPAAAQPTAPPKRALKTEVKNGNANLFIVPRRLDTRVANTTPMR